MAEEKIDRNEAEIEEKNVSGEVKTPDGTEQTDKDVPAKKTGRKIFFILFVLVVVGLAGVPQTRETITAKSKQIWEKLQSTDMKKASVPEAVQPKSDQQEVTENAIETQQQIESRLEQLENAREFENADVVIASAEPVSVTVTDPAYTVLADQQKALLAEIERLRRQLEQMRENTEQTVDRLKASIPDVRQFDERIAAVHVREDSLEQQLVQESFKINRLETNKADASAVLSLMTRMDATEQKLRVSGVERERAVALLLTVYQLREAAFSGNVFETERQSALALSDSFPRVGRYLRSLAGFSSQSVITKASLIRSFDSYADQVVLAEELSPKTDWFHQALNSLKALVVIRKTQPTGDDPSTQNVLARAGMAVRDEDLSEAVLILNGLKGKAAEAMQPWTQKAENYLFVKKTINETVSAVLGVVYAEQLKGE